MAPDITGRDIEGRVAFFEFWNLVVPSRVTKRNLIYNLLSRENYLVLKPCDQITSKVFHMFQFPRLSRTTGSFQTADEDLSLHTPILWVPQWNLNENGNGFVCIPNEMIVLKDFSFSLSRVSHSRSQGVLNLVLKELSFSFSISSHSRSSTKYCHLI